MKTETIEVPVEVKVLYPLVGRVTGWLVSTILLVVLAAVLVKTAEIAWAWVS